MDEEREYTEEAAGDQPSQEVDGEDTAENQQPAAAAESAAGQAPAEASAPVAVAVEDLSPK
jgi:hypothetical protein